MFVRPSVRAIVCDPYSFNWESLGVFTQILFMTLRYVMIRTMVIWESSMSLERKKCLRSLPFLWRNFGRSHLTQLLLATWGCVMKLNQIHVGKFMETVKKMHIFIIKGHFLSWKMIKSWNLTQLCPDIEL